MRKLHWAPALSLVLWIAGCAHVSGSGNVVTETRQVSDFDSVSLSGSAQLVINQDGTESLSITTDDNLLPHIASDVVNRTLQLGPKDLTNLSPTDDIVYTLTVRNLENLSISGSAKVIAQNLRSERLQISASGSVEITADGSVDEQEIQISGSGKYSAENLKSRAASMSISGSGNALIAAADSLDVNVSGSGDVLYVGDPVVTQNIAGSGFVRQKK